MIKRNIIISIVILATATVGAMVFSRPALADCMGVKTSIINCKDSSGKDAKTGEEAIYNILGVVIKIMTGVIGLVAVAAVVYGAILYGSASDNPENIKKAKEIWTNVVIGLIAFAFGTAAGVLFGKVMCLVTRGKVNPLIGSAGVSAVPMAARVSQKVGSEADPSNFLLMHAMGPNVAGVIGTAVAAGTFMAMFGVM